MKHLRFDLVTAYTCGEPGHAQTVMKKLGITYAHATPQSIADQWWFWCCENVPEKLPSYLEVMDVKPHEAVGYGLSREDADKIERIMNGTRSSV